MEYGYANICNPYMKTAYIIKNNSRCVKLRVGAVLALSDEIIGTGTNDTRHFVETCPRDEQGFVTGEGYELCKSACEQKSHAEISALRDCYEKGNSAYGADLYIYGHTYCCENCLAALEEAGVARVILFDSEVEGGCG